MRTRKAFVVALAVLLVAGIGIGILFATDQADDVAEALGIDELLGLDDESSSEQPDTPDPTVSGPMIEYVDFAHIVSELRENDVECEDDEVRGDSDLSEFGVCFANGGEFQISIYVLADPGDVDASVEQLKKQWDGDVVVGPNWYITTGDAELSAQVQEALGGEIHPS
ncbi:MAG TPA: hypothetical protein VJ927_01260 [Actinomycetota bacterium]|nr:hypothetical protein [Actinomycetota bacterium]